MKTVMKSIFPAPLLSIALLVLWLLLNRSVSAGQILLGLILGLLIPVLLRGLRPLPVRVSHPLSILKLAFRVVCDTSVSNFNVVRFLLLLALLMLLLALIAPRLHLAQQLFPYLR